MRNTKLIFSLCLLLPLMGSMKAQRNFVTSQYVYDLFLVNPAAAAVKTDCYSVNGYFQKQWLGTDLAPTTQMLTFQKAYLNRLGIGTYVFNDRNGNHREIGLQQTFAYGVTVEKTKRRLTNVLFGLSLNASQRSIDIANLTTNGFPDPIIGNGAQSGYGFNANTGVMLTVNNWELGFSATNIFPFTNTLYSSEEEPKVPMDLNIHAGTMFRVSDRNLYLEPLFYYRWNSYMDSRTDMNIKFLAPSIDPSFAYWGGVSYRRTMDESWGDNLAIGTTLGIIKGNFTVGLEYQFGLTNAQYEFGSAFQLVAGYRFCRNRKYEAIPCSKDTEKMKVGE